MLKKILKIYLYPFLLILKPFKILFTFYWNYLNSDLRKRNKDGSLDKRFKENRY